MQENNKSSLEFITFAKSKLNQDRAIWRVSMYNQDSSS
jgi:hypothetical protein